MALAIGLMSGTSIDGISAALVDIRGFGENTKLKVVKTLLVPYNEEEKKLILGCCDENAKLKDVSCLNFFLGKLFAKVALKLVKAAKIKNGDVEFIGSHGQTIYHNPKNGHTMQVGESSVIAKLTGIKVVSDFRQGDVAVGGEGAPLIPYVDKILFQNKKQGRIALNIGGIANITTLPKNGEVYAFDTGPGNMVIDELVRQKTNGKRSFDNGGRMATQGITNIDLLNELMENSFVKRKPPKSCGREEFGKHFVLKNFKNFDKDEVRTATEFTSESISYNIKNFVLTKHEIKEIIVSGGGSHNKTLIDMLRENLGMKVFNSTKFGIDADAKEAIGFAILANETLHMNKVNIATGAKKLVILGKVTYEG